MPRKPSPALPDRAKAAPTELPAGKPRLNFGGKWSYAPALESVPVPIAPRYELFIGGRFVPPKEPRYFESINPATEAAHTEIAEAGSADVDSAVRAARHARETVWGKMPGRERGKYLFRIARLIQEKARELAVIETLDGGKPIAEARGFDLPQVAAHFFYYAGWADKLDYAFPGRRTRPVGVCGQIVPWNFPLLMAAWKLAPALACGNCCVLKPAPSSSVSVLHLARIFQEAELPEGVVNILTGPDQTGRALVEHPDVNHLSFTGSTEAGREIARSVAATDKKLTLQLGGKAAHLIFEDAPIDQAIEGIVAGIFFNQGHLFHAGSRLLVQESILPVVVNKLRDRIARIRVGDPMDKNTDLGAIHSRRQLDRIRELVESAAQEGAEVIQPACVLPEKGCWFAPTLLNGVTDSHRVSREDIFGPVLGIMSFRTPEEAIELANHTPSGLSAGIWSDKGSQVFELIPRLRAGVVWANTYNQFDPASPFGGCKESGFGREGGLHGLAPYVELE